MPVKTTQTFLAKVCVLVLGPTAQPGPASSARGEVLPQQKHSNEKEGRLI